MKIYRGIGREQEIRERWGEIERGREKGREICRGGRDRRWGRGRYM